MIRIKEISLLALTLVLTTGLNAQQTRQSNMYGFNKYGFNPAYAGSSGCTEVNFSHMNQWGKVDGAPLTNFLSANTLLGKNFGIGANLMLDRSGMMQQFSSSLGVSYGVTIAREHHVRFGLSGGFFQVQVDPTDAIAFDAGDQIIEGGVQSSSALNTEAGLMYRFKGLELSFSSQQLLETRSNVIYNGLDGYGLKRHLIGFGSYKIPLNEKLTLVPNLLYKGINAANQFDINTDINYNDFIYGGLGYRTQVGIVGRIGVNVKKLFFIGYSYEIPLQNIATYGSGSHEIALGLKFCKKQKEDLPPIDDQAKVVTDTIRIVETIRDTVFIEKIDTVFIEMVSDTDVKDALLQAAKTLEFESDKAIIRKVSYGDLESLANILLMRPDLKISMEGHTDNEGTDEYNMQLSKDRVEAVKDFLVANGVEQNRIATAYFGESRPIADNNTEEGRKKNRRVEMKIPEK